MAKYPNQVTDRPEQGDAGASASAFVERLGPVAGGVDVGFSSESLGTRADSSDSIDAIGEVTIETHSQGRGSGWPWHGELVSCSERWTKLCQLTRTQLASLFGVRSQRETRAMLRQSSL